ncbi:MAG: hypothetical protein GWP03_05495 [Proteobacteria bacterium]|nr:hypothetical protein [Pseudomonadota bacterium]
MKKIGFSALLLVILASSTLFSLEILEPDSIEVPDVALMRGNTYIIYPFGISIGRQNPFTGDTDYVYYSNRIGGVITNASGLVSMADNGYNGVTLSRLLYGKVFGSNIFGAYLVHNYARDVSGKTGVTSFNNDSLNNYIIYQNLKWNNGKCPLILSFVSNYNENSLKYKVKLSGYNPGQFFNFEYDAGSIALQFSNIIKRFKLEGNLNTGKSLSEFGIFTYLDKSIFNMSEAGIYYDYYNQLFSVNASHTLRLDSKNLLKLGANYCFIGEAYTFNYYGIKPYIYSSFHYYFPSDSLKLSATALFNRKYYKGYLFGSVKYDTTFTYSLITYNTLIWEPKDALFLNPGVKIAGNEKEIEVSPVAEIKFIDASLYASYNLYWKRFSIVGKWDFYN